MFNLELKWVLHGLVYPKSTVDGARMPVASEAAEMRSISQAPIVLTVRAEFDQLPFVRTMAEVVGVLGDFNLDDVADIRLAIDEACSQLIIGAAAEAELTSSFMVSESALTTTVSARVVGSYTLPREGFGWQVLTTVADAVTVTEPADGGSRDREIVIELVKRRSRH